jgi:starch-binding outer membrane protein, SusD/RagB family
MQEIINKIKRSAAVLVLLGAGAACSDLLDQPVSGNFSELDFYKTEEEAQSALVAAYDAYSNAYNAVWSSVYLIRELPSDDTNAGGSDSQDQPGHQNLDDFKIDAQNDQIQGAWGNLWSALYRANKCINTTNEEFPLGRQIIAEAKVLRAFIYLDLVGLWGDVPLVLEDVTPDKFGNPERVSKLEILQFIADDLAGVAGDLPLKKNLGAGNKWRAHRGTAQAVRGKALLWKASYSNDAAAYSAAAAQLEEVITSNQYSLENNAIAGFSSKNEFGKESLFEINYSGEGTGFPWGSTADSNIIIQLMGPRSDFYAKATGDTLDGGWGFAIPREELYAAYEDAGDSERRDSFLWSQATLEDRGGDWTNAGAHDYEGFIRRKYGTYTTHTTGTNATDNYRSNFVLLRYADVLLMAAEANAKSNDEANARLYLNQVRTRPGTDLPEINSSGAALFTDIVTERRLELAFEGHRYMDLVRWGLADDELADLGFVSSKHEVLPIPQIEVTASGMAQNQNY